MPFHGKPWKKGSKIRVYSQIGARYDKAVDMASANYAPSRTGANIAVVRVKRRSQAQVVIRSMNTPWMPVGVTSSQGYPGPGRLIVMRLNLKLGGFEKKTKGYTEKGTAFPPDPYAATMLIAHELGHVVGLDHPRSASACTIENPAFFRVCKDRGEDDFFGSETVRTFSCDFVQKVDAQVLARTYGGKAKNITGKKICRMDTGEEYVRPPAPAPSQIGVSVTSAPGSRPVVRWTPPRDAEIFIYRFTMACSAVGDTSQSVSLGDPARDGLIDMAAGQIEDPWPFNDPQTNETITTPTAVCYRVDVHYGPSWGTHTVRTSVDATYQP